MNPSRRQFHVQNAAKCRQQASRSTVDSERRAWVRLAEEWEQLASRSGGADDAMEDTEYFDQDKAGVSPGRVTHREPHTS